MNRYQIFHYIHAKRADGSEIKFEFTRGWDAKCRLVQEQCVTFAEIPEAEYFNDPEVAKNVIHVERCDDSAKARCVRTYH